jgi:hypothetical protein
MRSRFELVACRDLSVTTHTVVRHSSLAILVESMTAYVDDSSST